MVHSIGEWETYQKCYYGYCSFFMVLQQLKHQSIAVRGKHVYADKKRLRWHRHINAFFGLKTVVNKKSINLGMISARHTTNRQSFKKVTFPFIEFFYTFNEATEKILFKKLAQNKGL